MPAKSMNGPRGRYKNLIVGNDLVSVCKNHCTGYDYCGMECPYKDRIFCGYLSRSELDVVANQIVLMYWCHGECDPACGIGLCDDPDSAVCNNRSVDRSRVDRGLCTGALIDDVRQSMLDGYAFGAITMMTFYPVDVFPTKNPTTSPVQTAPPTLAPTLAQLQTHLRFSK